MGTTREEVPVSSIVLNPGNYRHRPAQSQEEAIKRLFEGTSRRSEMLALATDIADRGLDLSNLPIVEPHKGHWRVLEGNRRFAAIKAMVNPDIIPDDLDDDFSPRAAKAYRDRFRNLGTVASLPRVVLCVVTDDPDFIHHVIPMKHSGVTFHKGAGTVPWDTEGRSRYEQALAGGTGRRPSNTQTANALAVVDALETHFAGDDELTTLAEHARKKGLTTLGRVIRKPEHQVRLGLRLDDDGVRFTVSRHALRTALAKILEDLGTPRLNSRTTNKAADVDAYLDSIREQLPTSADRLAQAEEATAPTASASATRVKRTKSSAPMRRVFPNMTLHHASDKTRQLLGEMRKLNINDHALVLSATMRMLIDLYTWDVYEALGTAEKDIPYQPGTRTRKALAMVDPLNARAKDRKFPRIHDALASNTGDLSFDTMHAFMHRPNHNPTPDTIRTQVAEYQPFLEALDQHVEDVLVERGKR